MDKVHFTARFLNIEKDKLSEFKLLAEKLLEITREEPGNLEYDLFFNPEESVCVVRETYIDSAAVFSHMELMKDLLPGLVELGGGFSAECYGHPTPELVEAAGMVGSVFHYFQGR
jgi:quinol monooxygenase YgiN